MLEGEVRDWRPPAWMTPGTRADEGLNPCWFSAENDTATVRIPSGTSESQVQTEFNA